MGLVWRLSKRIMPFRAGVAEEQLVDEDPWNPVEVQPVAPVGGGATAAPKVDTQGTSGLKENVLKMQSLIDQCDESELMPPDAREVNRWWQNYIAVIGAGPEESEEPTSSQVAALAKRVVTNNQAPYTVTSPSGCPTDGGPRRLRKRGRIHLWVMGRSCTGTSRGPDLSRPGRSSKVQPSC